MSCASKHIYRRAATNNENHYVADNMIFLVPAIVSILLAGKDASSHLGDITENCADLMYMQGGFGINDVVKDYGTIIKNDIDTIMVNIIQKWWNIPTTSNVDGLLKLNTTKDGGINVMEEARPIIDIIEQFFSSWRNDNGKGNDLFEQNLKLAYIYISILSSTTTFQNKFNVENGNNANFIWDTKKKEENLKYYCNFIIKGIQSNVISDPIRGSFRVNEKHKNIARLLNALLNRMDMECFSSDTIMKDFYNKIIHALSKNVMDECDMQKEININPTRNIELNYFSANTRESNYIQNVMMFTNNNNNNNSSSSNSNALMPERLMYNDDNGSSSNTHSFDDFDDDMVVTDMESSGNKPVTLSNMLDISSTNTKELHIVLGKNKYGNMFHETGYKLLLPLKEQLETIQIHDVFATSTTAIEWYLYRMSTIIFMHSKVLQRKDYNNNNQTSITRFKKLILKMRDVPTNRVTPLFQVATHMFEIHVANNTTKNNLMESAIKLLIHKSNEDEDSDDAGERLFIA